MVVSVTFLVTIFLCLLCLMPSCLYVYLSAAASLGVAVWITYIVVAVQLELLQAHGGRTW